MCKILVVEDDEAVAFATAEGLRARGHEVITVASSLKALSIIDAPGAIDVILADLVLAKGEPNGISLARMAQMKRPGMTTLLMTGHRDIAGDDCLMPGKLFYKPLDLDKLAAAIEGVSPAS